MSLRKKLLGAAALVATVSLYSLPANATIVVCGSDHGFTTAVFATGCVDSVDGLESLGSASYTDNTIPFLGSGGEFSFDSGLWNSWSGIAIGFYFDIGDSVFFQLKDDWSTGVWASTIWGWKPKHGVLKDVELYGSARSVPEPGTLALLGAALLGVGLVRRRRLQPGI